eukprot:14943062-Ditylum_brightwellii.AAC.1
MATKETLHWMAEQNILRHWILPGQGLNKGTHDKYCPSGNSLDLNALDSNCNQDTHCTVLKHVYITATLKGTDKCKFSVSTLRKQDNTYLFIWEQSLQIIHPMQWEAGVPSLKRIMEDMNHIQDHSVTRQFQARGYVVNGCGTCRGQEMKAFV